MLGPDNMSAIAIRHTGVNREVMHTLILTLNSVTVTRKHLIYNEHINALLSKCTRLKKQKGPERIRAI